MGLVVLVLGCQERPLPSPDALPLNTLADPAADPVGTYRFWIGSDSMLMHDTSRAVKRGILVVRFWAWPEDTAEFHTAYPTVENMGFPPDSGVDGTPPNACFVFDSTGRKGRGFAGIQRQGYMHLMDFPPVGKVHFWLYQSPDAFYTVEAVHTEAGMIGVGRSFGFGHDDRSWDSEYFVAKRLGEPEWNRCPRF